jgi:hypothetical protein
VGFEGMQTGRSLLVLPDEMPLCLVSSETASHFYKAARGHIRGYSCLHHYRGDAIETYIPKN